MAKNKTLIVNALKAHHSVKTVKELNDEFGLKISEDKQSEGNFILNVWSDKESDINRDIADTLELLTKLGFDVTRTGEVTPVSKTKNDETTYFGGATFTVANNPANNTQASRPRKNMPVEEWAEDWDITFRIRNFNRSQDGDIYTKPVEFNQRQQFADLVRSGEGTGGYQLLLLAHDEEGVLRGSIKKYCAKSHAMEQIPPELVEEIFPTRSQRMQRAKAEAEAETTAEPV